MSLKSRKRKLKESGMLKSRVRVKTWQLSVNQNQTHIRVTQFALHRREVKAKDPWHIRELKLFESKNMQSLTLNSEQNKKRIDNDQNYGLN